MRVTFKDGANGANRFNDLLDKIPVRDLADRLGTDEATASEALVAALPALLAKLQDNASSQQGAASLASALQQHNNDLARGSQVNLSQIDTQDGNNIFRHVFGNQRQEVAQQLASNTNKASSGLLDSLLPMLAPIAMSFISNQLLGGGRQGQQGQLGQQPQQQQYAQQPAATGHGADLGPDLGSLLGGLLGGRQASQQQDGGIDSVAYWVVCSANAADPTSRVG